MATETPAASGSGWRQRWADKENDAQRRAHEAALRSWRQQDAELTQLRAVAARFRGSTEPTAAPWLKLGREEVVLCVLPNVRLVESRDPGPLPAPDLTQFPFLLDAVTPGLLPPGIDQADTGTAVVTNHRVAFQGGLCRREWSYGLLGGVVHDSSVPLSLLGVTNRRIVSGLLVSEGQAPTFRFNLTLAVANAAGQRAAFVALLDGLIAAHRGLAPAAPEPVTPQDAPIRAFLARGKVALVGVAVVALLALTFALTSIGPGNTPPAVATATSAPGATEQVDAAALDPGPTETAPAETPTPPATPTVAPTKTASKSPTPGKTTAKGPTPTPRRTTAPPAPQKPDLCGAPQNPYGYNFCGGSLIRSPASGVCSYFNCVDNFPSGGGYMVQCQDGRFSMSGGTDHSCFRHGGPARPVYR